MVLVAVLAGAWWQAKRQPRILTINGLSESGYYVVAVPPGSIVIEYYCVVDTPVRGRDSAYLDVVTLPGLTTLEDFELALQPLDMTDGENHRLAVGQPLLGTFGMTGEIEQSDFDDPVWFGAYRTTFPIWLPWLLFNSCAFLACRRLEKRADAVVAG